MSGASGNSLKDDSNMNDGSKDTSEINIFRSTFLHSYALLYPKPNLLALPEFLHSPVHIQFSPFIGYPIEVRGM